MADVVAIGPDDWRAWRDVRLAALAAAPDAFGSTFAEWETASEARWRDRLISVPFNALAVVGGVSVGQVSGTALDEDGAVELISMWVAPGARGRGVADQLIAAVVDAARGQGAATVRLSVRRDNHRAMAVYRRLGFVDAGPGDEERELAMALPIGA